MAAFSSYNETAKCAVESCPNPNGIIYHSFPHKSELQELWIEACGRKNLIPCIKNAKICSRHFSSDSYERDLRNELLGLPVRKKLKSNAIPTLLLNENLIKEPKSATKADDVKTKKVVLSVVSAENQPVYLLADVKVLEQDQVPRQGLRNSSVQNNLINADKLESLRIEVKALQKEISREQARTGRLKRRLYKSQSSTYEERIVRSFLRKRFNASQTKFLMSAPTKDNIKTKVTKTEESCDHTYTVADS